MGRRGRRLVRPWSSSPPPEHGVGRGGSAQPRLGKSDSRSAHLRPLLLLLQRPRRAPWSPKAAVAGRSSGGGGDGCRSVHSIGSAGVVGLGRQTTKYGRFNRTRELLSNVAVVEGNAR